MKGIYAYWDNKLSKYVYIGKDSRIDINKRHKDHFQPSLYDAQQINRVLQNNPNRYEYKIICEYPDLTDDELNYLEIKEIMKHKFLYDEKPKFNYTIGGDGNTGYRHTEETKQKMKENYNGYKTQIKKGQHLSIETEFKKGHKPWNTGKKRPELSKEKHPNWKNYARIVKKGFTSSGKQVYAIAYNGNKRLKLSVDKESLRKWFEENYPNIKLVYETKEEKQQ